MSTTWPHVVMFMGVLCILAVLVDSINGGGASWAPITLGAGIVLYVIGRVFVHINKK